MKKYFKRRCHNRYTVKNIFGIILIIIGLVIILKVLPLNFWLFLFGVAIVCSGVFLYKYR